MTTTTQQPQTIEQKIQAKIDYECGYAEQRGSTKFSVCDYANWDKDYWAHRHTMIDAIRKRGYSVSVSVNHGVTDITITKQLQVN